VIVPQASFPLTASGIQAWARDQGLKSSEARRRFASIVVICSLGMNRSTGNSLAFKGGNALRFAYGSPRSTLDLDYTASADGIPDDENQLSQLLDGSLRTAEIHFGIKTRCQSIRRNPRRSEATRPTYQVRVAYQFPGDRYFHEMDLGRNVSEVIDLEISLNDLVCETSEWRPNLPQSIPIRACSHEDILAEKLRSLLQQPIRKRHRCQDVFDLAFAWRNDRERLDLHKIYQFFVQKCAIRQIEPAPNSFDHTIREMAQRDYDARIKEQTGDAYIPFDEAWRDVLALVESLAWKR
jgi:predicted nucleotidyltransferase component of viral defense system